MTFQEADKIINNSIEHIQKMLDYLGSIERQTKYVVEVTGCSEEIAKQISEKFSNRMYEHRSTIPKRPPTVECPYCKSTNTSKIGVVGRSVSFGLFGFGSSKVGKQWHCNSCKSDF